MHSRKGRRYSYTTRGPTFAEIRETRLTVSRRPPNWSPSCSPCPACLPPQAHVAGFDLDERTGGDGRARAGRHDQRYRGHHVESGQVELDGIQVDEMYIKAVAVRAWMGEAMAVPSRLWLTGVMRPKRDLALITAVVPTVRSSTRSLAILVCVNGLARHVTARARLFRDPQRTGRRGRPRPIATAGLLPGQVIKHHAGRCVVGYTRRVEHGTAAAIAAVHQATGTGPAGEVRVLVRDRPGPTSGLFGFRTNETPH